MADHHPVILGLKGCEEPETGQSRQQIKTDYKELSREERAQRNEDLACLLQASPDKLVKAETTGNLARFWSIVLSRIREALGANGARPQESEVLNLGSSAMTTKGIRNIRHSFAPSGKKVVRQQLRLWDAWPKKSGGNSWQKTE